MLSRKVIIAAAAVLLFCAVLNKEARAQFQLGDFLTWPQDKWGAPPSPGNVAQLMLDRFDIVYGGGAVEVGIIGTGFSMVFTSGVNVVNYLPASGGNGPLNSDLIDPTSTASGAFGGHVLALQFVIDFNDAGEVTGLSSIPVGDLVLANLTQYAAFNGLTIREYLAEANNFLGGGLAPYTYDAIAQFTDDVIRAFDFGSPNQFAQDHLRIPGDFNQDRTVNAADYVAWRKNDATPDGYNEWQTNFGLTTVGGGGSSSVPEPAAVLLLAMGGLVSARLTTRHS